MIKKLLLFSIASLFVIACSSKNDSTDDALKPLEVGNECEWVSMSQHDLQYCYEPGAVREARGRSQRVVYFFHGIGGNAKNIFQGEEAKLVQKAHELLGKAAPLFVGLSIGQEGVFHGSLVTDFLQNGMQRIESAFGIVVSGRDLIGKSMGAFNALRIAAGSPESFSSIAALCPPLVYINPFDQKELEAYVARHEEYLSRPLLMRVLNVLKKEFQNFQNFQSNNPFYFLNRGAYDQSKLFLSVGRKDSLGFFEGSELFRKISSDRGLDLSYSPVEGRHCAYSAQDLGLFLFSGL